MGGQISGRNPVIDILKGIGIVSMVMGHSNFGSLFEIYIAGFHMQLFFIISGYLFKPNRHPQFKEYLKRKIYAILTPYALFAIITIIICEIINLFTSSKIYTGYEYFIGIIWSNQSIFPITGAIWFLQCTFWIEIGYYFIAKMKSLLNATGIVMAICLFSAVTSKLDIYLPFAIDSALSGMVFYHFGYMISKYKKEKNSGDYHQLKFFIWVITFCFNVYLILLNGSVNPRTCEYSNFMLYYLNALIGTYIWFDFSYLIYLGNTKIVKNLSKCLQYIGLNSIVFLGFNQLIIMGLYRLFSGILPVEISYIRAARNFIICLLTLVICIILTKVFHNNSFGWMIGKMAKNKV
ncbi:acyltransferase family protein [Enterocloster bolteae]|uniref:acyltransferase family protein n=1 Tax=Enterocloster bolteae TaxID=208479 RepID=UPI003AF156DE